MMASVDSLMSSFSSSAAASGSMEVADELVDDLLEDKNYSGDINYELRPSSTLEPSVPRG